MIDISGIDKATLLAALFNESKAQGRGVLQDEFGGKPMPVEYAQQYIDHLESVFPFPRGGKTNIEIDYFQGRPLKINITDDLFDPGLFDRDNGGPGTAQKIIDQLRTP